MELYTVAPTPCCPSCVFPEHFFKWLVQGGCRRGSTFGSKAASGARCTSHAVCRTLALRQTSVARAGSHACGLSGGQGVSLSGGSGVAVAQCLLCRGHAVQWVALGDPQLLAQPLTGGRSMCSDLWQLERT